MSMADDLNAMHKRREQDRIDAARYRWLCEQDHSDRIFIATGRNGAWGECGHSSFGGFKDIADKAVDEAMAAAGVTEVDGQTFCTPDADTGKATP